MPAITALLPALAFVCIFLYLRINYPTDSPRRTWIESMILWACWMVLSLELLSLVHGVTRTGLALAWFLPCAWFAVWVYKRWKAGRSVSISLPSLPKTWLEWIAALPVALVVLITLVVAWQTPPQTWDSLTYHMPRVAHWAQERSVGHYITGIERQNGMSPGAEMSILVFYVLGGSDRLATLPQWFAMLGSVIGVSLAAGLLGAAPLGQWLAAGFAATIPMGIVQASSTITDYTAAAWCVYAAVECLLYLRENQHRSLIFAALAAGLGFLAKATAATYLVMFGIWVVVLLTKREGLRGLLRWGLTALLAAVLLNAGFIGRNLVTFHTITSPSEFKHNNQLKTLPGLVSNLLRNSGTQAGLPYVPAWNDELYQLILKAHVKLGVALDDPRTTLEGVFSIHPPTTQEDLTTNPVHAYLILATFCLALGVWRWTGKLATWYALLVCAGLAFFSLVFKWNGFGSRYMLLFFVLFAPTVGVILGWLRPRLIGILVILVMLISARPWLLSIDSRPLIPIPGRSVIDSILVEPRLRLYFANAGTLQEPYQQIANAILSENCRKIGLRLWGDDPEYLFWVVLGAPQKDLELEWDVVGTPSMRYKNPEFQPCAVICKDCKEASVNDLPLALDFGDLRLFLRPAE